MEASLLQRGVGWGGGGGGTGSRLADQLKPLTKIKRQLENWVSGNFDLSYMMEPACAVFQEQAHHIQEQLVDLSQFQTVARSQRSSQNRLDSFQMSPEAATQGRSLSLLQPHPGPASVPGLSRLEPS